MKKSIPQFIAHAGEMSRLALYQQAFLIGLQIYATKFPYTGANDNELAAEKYGALANRFAQSYAEGVFQGSGEALTASLNEVP